jgi:hypothetical protein
MRRRLTPLMAIVALAAAAPAARGRSLREPAEPVRSSSLAVQSFAGLSLFGPVSYDRLGTFSKTGVAKRDPQTQSAFFGLATQHPLAFGGYYLKLFGRAFQAAANATNGTYTDGETGLERHNKVSSHGFGAGFGWEFRARNRFIRFLPHLGVVYERNVVEVTGDVTTQPAGADTALNFRSRLDGVYAEPGFSYRLLLGEVEPDLTFAVAIPLKSKVVNDADNAEEEALTERLYHGLRFAMAFGGALTVWLD